MKFLTFMTEKSFRFLSWFIIAAAIVIVPMRVISLGWSPDAGVFMASCLNKLNLVPISDEVIIDSIKALKPLYPSAVEDNLLILIVSGFALINFAGLCLAPNHMAWIVAMDIVMLTNDDFAVFALSGSPIAFICVLILFVISMNRENMEKNPYLSCFMISVFLSVVILAGIKTELFGFFFLNMKPQEVWQLTLKEFWPIFLDNAWLLLMPFVFAILACKKKATVGEQLSDPLLLITLALQFAYNLGFFELSVYKSVFLAAFLALRISKIIPEVEAFKNMRVKYLMSLFFIVCFIFLAAHDGNGRFSKIAIHTTPVDFTMGALEDWAPGEGGIIYNDTPTFAIRQLQLSYNDVCHLYGYCSLIPEERENVLRMQLALKHNQRPLPEYYEPWVEAMRPQDRLVASEKINGLENIAWLQIGRKAWIGKKVMKNEE